MSRKLKAEDIKVGMLVRVSREENAGWSHGIKFGAVCEVVQPSSGWLGEALIKGPLIDECWNLEQTVAISSLKLAKQATKKVSK